jgi:oligopeptide/dipeptide ABC transporter ATP-binding protein
MLLRLCEPTSGRILFRGNDVTKTKQRRLLPLRRQAQIVLQDAGSALDPRMTVAEILDEPFTIHALSTGEARIQRLRELLAVVELPEDVLKRFPHQLSGGQQQRLCIARALALNPTILVCDEAFSGLDVPLKAQMANLLVDLRERLGLTYLFVSHELSWVRYLTDRIAVMFQGRIVEVGPTRSVFGGPLHPYTRGMLAAEPRILAKSPVALPVLSPTATSTLSTEGCGYAPRCDRVIPHCHAMQPQLVKAGDIEVACHHYTS